MFGVDFVVVENRLAGTEPLNWNQTGPAGVSGYELVEAVTVRTGLTGNEPFGFTETAQPRCSAGKVALGGGVHSNLYQSFVVSMSRPDFIVNGRSGGWEGAVVKANNFNLSDRLDVHVWVICANVS